MSSKLPPPSLAQRSAAEGVGTALLLATVVGSGMKMQAVAALDFRPVSRLFKALGDETRLRLVVLLTHGELCVCHLEVALRLPSLSPHAILLCFATPASWSSGVRVIIGSPISLMPRPSGSCGYG